MEIPSVLQLVLYMNVVYPCFLCIPCSVTKCCITELTSSFDCTWMAYTVGVVILLLQLRNTFSILSVLPGHSCMQLLERG